MVLDDPVHCTVVHIACMYSSIVWSFADQFYACVRPGCVYVIIFYMLCFVVCSLAGRSSAVDLPMFEGMHWLRLLLFFSFILLFVRSHVRSLVCSFILLFS